MSQTTLPLRPAIS